MAQPLTSIPSYLDPVIAQAATQYNIDPAYLRAVLMTESRGRIDATGPMTRFGVRAQGIGQFMPGTAKDMGVQNPYDPYDAIPGVARLLDKGLTIAAQRNEADPAAWAARYYNAGLPHPSTWNSRENQNYAPTVSRYYATESQYLAQNPSAGAPPAGVASSAAGPLPANWGAAGGGATLGPGQWRPVGDSLAGGFINHGGLPGFAVTQDAAQELKNAADAVDGRNSTDVLAYLKSLGDLHGTPIMLSTGISNGGKNRQADMALVPQMLATLAEKNAGPIRIVGVGTKAGYEGSNYFDLNQYNAQLQQAAQDASASGQDVGFLGGIPNAVVHPATGYYKRALGTLGAPPQPAPSVIATVTTPSSSSDATPTDDQSQAPGAPLMNLPPIPDTSLPLPASALDLRG